MDTSPRRQKSLAAIDQIVGEAAVPGLPGLQFNVKAQTTIGIYRGAAVALGRVENHLTNKVSIAVGDTQRLSPLRPVGRNAPTSYDLVAFHFEYVGKIGSNSDFQIEANRRLAVVRHFDIFVQTAIDMPANHKAQCSCGDRPLLAHEGSVREEDARGVVGNGAPRSVIPRSPHWRR